MTYTSCSGCYKTTGYNIEPTNSYRFSSSSHISTYSSNKVQDNFAPADAYALTGKAYNPQ